mmetsp:Transcript_19973/g.22853  ORF Transcript_19973/g.22853 Transcript_19973/m.22853 type:complete len:780 (+) Transcript_19973:220-2559(+)
MSAITERSKRRTAGKRMQNLLGKAMEEDETFWNHDTWDDSSDGNESFVNDVEEKDEFDSDFNDSESDNEAQEVAVGEEEERQIRREERGRRGCKGRGKARRIMGEGVNSGLVLIKPDSFIPPLSKSSTVARELPLKASSIKISKPKENRATLATTRPRRDSQIRSTSKDVKTTAKRSAKRKAVSQAQQTFTQEELLLEAVTKTEPENERWLLGRKRAFAEVEATQKLIQNSSNYKLISRYISKRGSYISLTFSDMDAVPAILQPSIEPPKQVSPVVCVISGEPARYKDPKTGMGYENLVAFQELRRRFGDKKEREQLERKIPLKRGHKHQPQLSAQKHQPQKKETVLKQEHESIEHQMSKKKRILKQVILSTEQLQGWEILEQKCEETQKKPHKIKTETEHVVSNSIRSSTDFSTVQALTSRAQQTVQDPERKLTMRTRNASKLLENTNIDEKGPNNMSFERQYTLGVIKSDTNAKLSAPQNTNTLNDHKKAPMIQQQGNSKNSSLAIIKCIDQVADNSPRCTLSTTLKPAKSAEIQQETRPEKSSIDVNYTDWPIGDYSMNSSVYEKTTSRTTEHLKSQEQSKLEKFSTDINNADRSVDNLLIPTLCATIEVKKSASNIISTKQPVDTPPQKYTKIQERKKTNSSSLRNTLEKMTVETLNYKKFPEKNQEQKHKFDAPVATTRNEHMPDSFTSAVALKPIVELFGHNVKRSKSTSERQTGIKSRIKIPHKIEKQNHICAVPVAASRNGQIVDSNMNAVTIKPILKLYEQNMKRTKKHI